MKKIFTLAIASLLTVAAFAADRRASVTVQTSRNFEVVIDGKSYSGNGFGSLNIANLRDGYHTVTIYDARRGFFKRSKRAISITSFMLRGNDINIFVDMFGKVQVNEVKTQKGWDKGFQKDKDDHGKFDNGRRY